MPTVLNPVSDVDKKDEILQKPLPQTTITEEDKINVAKSNKSRAFEALIRQRITYQWNQRRSNCKLCLCPLIAMFILLAIFSGLDALVKLGEERAQLRKIRVYIKF